MVGSCLKPCGCILMYGRAFVSPFSIVIRPGKRIPWPWTVGAPPKLFSGSPVALVDDLEEHKAALRAVGPPFQKTARRAQLRAAAALLFKPLGERGIRIPGSGLPARLGP